MFNLPETETNADMAQSPKTSQAPDGKLVILGTVT